jgi:hypothetical protein
MTSPLLCAPQLKQFYLGPAGNLRLLTMPDAGVKITLDQGKVDHSLVGGPHAVQRLGKTRRLYELDFSQRTWDQADLVTSIYAGMLGPGPYYLIDPAFRNLLPAHISGAGQIDATSAGFFVSAGGAVAFTSTVTPPPLAPLCGVQDWTTVQNSFLWLNASAANITEAGAPPVNPAEPFTAATWLRTAAGATNVQLLAYFTDINGASAGTVSLVASAALTTTWQRFGAALAPASVPAGAVTYGLALKALSVAPPHVYVSAPDIQQASGAVDPAGAGPSATLLAPWVLGLGVPKMLPYGTMAANSDRMYARRSHVLTLVEAE